jgi:CheY-like chemotaxis protein
VITDLQMPEMNGLELIQKIRQEPATRDLPVLMLTAKGYELGKQDLESKLGVLAVMTKPFSPRELLRIVNHTLQPCLSPAD